MIFEKIVKKLSKYSGKVLSTQELIKITTGGSMDQKHMALWYKIARLLVIEGKILSLRSGVYLVLDQGLESELQKNQNTKQSLFVLSKKYYWPILHSLFRDISVSQEVILIGQKALEIHLQDFFIPKRIQFLSRSTSFRGTVLTGYQVYIAPSLIEPDTGRSNFYSLTRKHSIKVSFNEYTFYICCIEQALLESLLTRSGGMIERSIFLRALERMNEDFRAEVFLEFCQMRYITAVNRLYQLTEGMDIPHIRQACLQAINRYGNGGLFTRKRAGQIK